MLLGVVSLLRPKPLLANITGREAVARRGVCQLGAGLFTEKIYLSVKLDVCQTANIAGASNPVPKCHVARSRPQAGRSYTRRIETKGSLESPASSVKFNSEIRKV